MMRMMEQMQAEMKQMHEQMRGHMTQMRDQMMELNGMMQHRAEMQKACQGVAAAAPAPQ